MGAKKSILLIKKIRNLMVLMSIVSQLFLTTSIFRSSEHYYMDHLILICLCVNQLASIQITKLIRSNQFGPRVIHYLIRGYVWWFCEDVNNAQMNYNYLQQLCREIIQFSLYKGVPRPIWQKKITKKLLYTILSSSGIPSKRR